MVKRSVGIAASVGIVSVCFLAPMAGATVVNFGPTAQAITYTGQGGNIAGLGQSRVTWGTCSFDGSITKCVVSAPFTGLGGGGSLSMVLTYQGNGPSPVIATSISPSSDIINLSLSSGSLITTLTENNGTTVSFYSTFVNYTFNSPACTGTSPCSIGQTGLTPNATYTGTVTGTFDPTPQIRNSLGVISASAFGAYSALAPGTWMEIYGINLATVISQMWGGADFKGNLAPTALGGTTVTIGGLPAFIDFVSPGQVNAQVPSGVGLGLQPVVVTTQGGASTAFNITVNAVQPGLLAPAVFKLAAGQYVAATFPDGVTFVLPPIAGAPTARAKPGDTIIFYGVGFGAVTPDSPAGQIVTQANQLKATFTASFGGVPATVSFAGLTGGYLGLYQFNVVVPNVPASDAVPFTYSLGGVAGPQNLIIAIQN
jgi:uncharacterized protein (TIGR03437 family)